MVLEQVRKPLALHDVPKPTPAAGQLLIRVSACAVCRTDLHIVDGELPHPKLPLILGHQIVGYIEEIGSSANQQSQISNQQFAIGDRVGVPWLGWTDGDCVYCRSSRENLCDSAQFTGYTIDGGYAEFTVADARYCFHLDNGGTTAVSSHEFGTRQSAPLQDVDVAPLLCAGMLGYRSYRKCGDAQSIGIYGFGNAAYLITQVAVYQKKQIYAFTRPGDKTTQTAALSLGAVWAGGSDEAPPEKLDAAIVFAPVGALVPAALGVLVKGGIVVCGGIHMSDIPSFPYVNLWGERVITSVANLTRRDGEEFLELARGARVKTQAETFPLDQANEALEQFRAGRLKGTAVLQIADRDL
jgi:propanol-preferring alcohol dehydrogenase